MLFLYFSHYWRKQDKGKIESGKEISLGGMQYT